MKSFFHYNNSNKKRFHAISAHGITKPFTNMDFGTRQHNPFCISFTHSFAAYFLENFVCLLKIFREKNYDNFNFGCLSYMEFRLPSAKECYCHLILYFHWDSWEKSVITGNFMHTHTHAHIQHQWTDSNFKNSKQIWV